VVRHGASPRPLVWIIPRARVVLIQDDALECFILGRQRLNQGLLLAKKTVARLQQCLLLRQCRAQVGEVLRGEGAPEQSVHQGLQAVEVFLRPGLPWTPIQGLCYL
jgi:hypothetical protein